MSINRLAGAKTIIWFKTALMILLLEINLRLASGISRPAHTKCAFERCDVSEKSLRFFLIGDWGGLPVWPYTTKGQRRVARAMAEVGDQKNTHFQVSLGDNIYTLGAKSLHDVRFEKTFEKVYDLGKTALYQPWYMIAGNHDYYGDIKAQLDYTSKGNRWAFPDYNYTIRYRLANKLTIDIVMIDTIILCGNTKEGKFRNFFQYFRAKESDRQTQGPENATKAKKLWTWLEKQLKDSRADYLFVAGHYPVYSTGEHGSTPCLVHDLRPLLHKYKVNAYFAGHDHGMEHLRETADGWTVHHIVSGAGALEMWSDKHKKDDISNISLYSYPRKKAWFSMAAKMGWCKGSFVYAELGPQEGVFRYYLSEPPIVDHWFTVPRRRL